MKPYLLILVFAVLCFGVSCGDDDAVRHDPIIPPDPDLTEKWHVLYSMELAYTRRRLDRYDQLLDDNFTFYLADGDVAGGLPPSWDRAVEMGVNTLLFMKDPPPAPMPRCKSIKMDIKWEDANGNPAVSWVEITSPGLPDETWYTATVFFNFQIDVEPDLTYINNTGAKAQFTVRNAGTDEMPSWRLVELREIGSGPPALTTARATEPSTLGQVKAIYR
jgi:hypothetical protein